MLGMLGFLAPLTSFRVPTSSIYLLLDSVTGAGVSPLSSIGAFPMASSGAIRGGWNACVIVNFMPFVMMFTALICFSIALMFSTVPLLAFHFRIHRFSLRVSAFLQLGFATCISFAVSHQ